MFGEGSTQGSPVSSYAIARRQPFIGTTCRSTSRASSARNISASSPTVMPWRTASGCIPTNERYSGSSTLPSTASPPIGFGRSRTTTRLPSRAQAAITWSIV
jgi:hypothetical protein